MMVLKFFVTPRVATKWLEMTKASGFVRKKWTTIAMESPLLEWVEEIEGFELFLWEMVTWLTLHAVPSVNSTMAMPSTTEANVRITHHRPLLCLLQTAETTEAAARPEERRRMTGITAGQMIDGQLLVAMSTNAPIATATAAIDAHVETVDIVNAHQMPQKLIVTSARTEGRRGRMVTRGAAEITRSVIIALVAAIGMTRVGDHTRVVAVGGIHVARLPLPLRLLPLRLLPRPAPHRPPHLARESIAVVTVDHATAAIATSREIAVTDIDKRTGPTKVKKTAVASNLVETTRTIAITIIIIIDRHRRHRQSEISRRCVPSDLLRRCTRTHDTNTSSKLKRRPLLPLRPQLPSPPPLPPSPLSMTTTTVVSSTTTLRVPASRRSR